MARASLILGIVGGCAGLLVFVRLLTVPFKSQPGLSGLDLGIEMLNFAVLFAGPGAFLGIMGGLVSFYRSTAGGIVLATGFATVSFGWIFVLAESVEKAFYADFFFFTISLTFLWWSGLILMGALFAFPKTREILRKSWEPWPGAKPMGKIS